MNRKPTFRRDPLLYQYGMRFRGYSPGCQPKAGLIFVKDDPNGRYYSILEYVRKLSDDEIRQYELEPCGYRPYFV